MREDIADLQTYRAMPTRELEMIDPFLFLNHHGYQVYPKNNNGLPFGPHPHRGFETVTYILEGDIAHTDSSGHSSVIKKGGVQWMTAGKGLVHSEMSSSEFKKNGGPLEVLQLWINLPSSRKMTKPAYKGLQAEEIPLLTVNDKVKLQLIAGHINNHKGAFEPIRPVTTFLVEISSGGEWKYELPENENLFFYVIRGNVEVNRTKAAMRNTVLFDSQGKQLHVTASTDSLILICHALPIGEPVFAYGPFVMTNRREIEEAIRDYQNGLFE